jgi:hypothetical protein
MRRILERRGYAPSHAERLLEEGMGTEELRGRVVATPFDLTYTHNIPKVCLPPGTTRG